MKLAPASRSARRPTHHAWLVAALALLSGCGRDSADGQVRIGYFPNLTHAQALVGLARGDFQAALPKDTRLRRYEFNAGPSVIEALFAGELDLAYVGPNPAINGYVRSNGQALRAIAGAVSGGAVLVVRADTGINSPADLAGTHLASPQLGNTQDVALRDFLGAQGLKLRERGGDVRITPIQNADILSAFLRKEIDGAWVPEPWGSRLVHEAGGRVLLDERQLWPAGQFTTTLLIARTGFLERHRDLVERWLAAHLDVTAWIRANPEEAKRLVNGELERLTGKRLPEPVLDEAWSRLELTYDPLAGAMLTAADHAFELGFLGSARPDLKGFYELSPLNAVLQRRRLPPVATIKELGAAALR